MQILKYKTSKHKAQASKPLSLQNYSILITENEK